MKHLDLFSGIGGFALAASWVWPDHEVVAFCDNEPFCQKVLNKHWPDVPVVDDIRKIKREDYGTVDLITGGFPCQPFSCAGKRGGTGDDRYLWPEMLRVIREARPAWVIGENVAGIINVALDQVCSDLENEDYAVQPFIVPACAVNAPHRRDRVWIVANSIRGIGDRRAKKQGRREEVGTFTCRTNSHAADPEHQRLFRWSSGSNPDSKRLQASEQTRDKSRGTTPRCNEDAANTGNTGLQEWKGKMSKGKGQGGRPITFRSNGSAWFEPWIEAATRLCGVDARVSHRVDRLKSLGNAIVPQVAAVIMEAIKTQEGSK